MKTVVGEERSQSRGRMSGIIVTEFCHGEESGPIGLLKVTVDPDTAPELNLDAPFDPDTAPELNLDAPFVHLFGDGR